MRLLLLAWFVAIAAGFGLSIVGCSKPAEEKAAVEGDKQVVIQIDDRKIDTVFLEKYLQSRTGPMNTDNPGDVVKKRVDDLVVEELLYREALRLKLDQAPDARQRIMEILSAKLIAEQVDQTVRQRKVEQTELQAYYDAHQDEFIRPEEARVADVLIAVSKGAPDAARAELKLKAEKVLAEALALANPQAGFAQLVQKYSDRPEKYPKGETGYFSAEGKPAGIDPRIADAAFKLEKGGDIATAVVEAEDGYHVLMLTGRRPAFTRPIDKVARELERRIKGEDVRKKREELIRDLKAKAKIEINEKVVAQIQEKLQTARKTNQMMPPNRNMPPNPGTGERQIVPPMGDRPPSTLPGEMPPQPQQSTSPSGDPTKKAVAPFVQPK